MKTEYVRIYKSVHTWVSIVSGMALFIAFYAGALGIFKEPLNRWAAPPRLEQALTPLADTPQLITQTLARAPAAAKGFVIYLEDAEHIPARMAWRVRGPGDGEDNASAPVTHIASLDAQGQAQVEPFQGHRLATFIDHLHRVVGLPVDNDANRWIMGVFATLYALALFSGVVILLPSLAKDLFALRIGKNLKRMWLDTHNVVGVVSLPFHIVIAVTAVVFAFHDPIYAVQDSTIHAGAKPAGGPRERAAGKAAAKRDPASMVPPASLVDAVKTFAPSFEPSFLQYRRVGEASAEVRVWGKDAAGVMPRPRGGFVSVDPYTGKITSSDRMPGRQEAPALVIHSLFALHMGAFGGAPVQWMYFVMGLAGAWLFYSGNLLWVESRRVKPARGASDSDAPPAQRRHVQRMANACVGVCLGCVCGLSLSIVSAKWLQAHVDNMAVAHQWVYYGAFFAALGWSFWHGAARAAIHLLWLAAAFTLAIPATSLLGRLQPELGLWAHGSAVSLGVDLVALAGGLCFAGLARLTQRRAWLGPADSIWSVKPRACAAGL
ncbi:PepSY-associated TM helix domain-containing protein [Aquabacterium sp. OR-4]|uniref:PepSY-associated TM helix domain-containing protein n=1 Tax=Aquabacterium sp. OR-4 TaxID=2978127 RepID=UPI0021B241BC|nr:PepSY-associated TM helix domain-containing protein [Aquabacterium sp. OR-4]MDT7835352.1 PepSY-associated TM helix domain-containing protein [Aquabacterium sp. OR-4]